VRTSAKLRQSDLLRVVHGPSNIRRDLEQKLGRIWSTGHVRVGELWALYCRYPYLARLRNRHVLDEGVRAGLDELAWTVTGFALATGYNEATGKYAGSRPFGAPPRRCSGRCCATAGTTRRSRRRTRHTPGPLAQRRSHHTGGHHVTVMREPPNSVLVRTRDGRTIRNHHANEFRARRASGAATGVRLGTGHRLWSGTTTRKAGSNHVRPESTWESPSDQRFRSIRNVTVYISYLSGLGLAKGEQGVNPVGSGVPAGGVLASWPGGPAPERRDEPLQFLAQALIRQSPGSLRKNGQVTAACLSRTGRWACVTRQNEWRSERWAQAGWYRGVRAPECSGASSPRGRHDRGLCEM
jgi:hypothetical protein